MPWGESLALLGPWFPPLWAGAAVMISGTLSLEHKVALSGSGRPRPQSCFWLKVREGMQATSSPLGSAGLGGVGVPALPGWLPWGRPRGGSLGLGGLPLTAPPGAGQEGCPVGTFSFQNTLSPTSPRPTSLVRGGPRPGAQLCTEAHAGRSPLVLEPAACSRAWAVGSRLRVAFAPQGGPTLVSMLWGRGPSAGWGLRGWGCCAQAGLSPRGRRAGSTHDGSGPCPGAAACRNPSLTWPAVSKCVLVGFPTSCKPVTGPGVRAWGPGPACTSLSVCPAAPWGDEGSLPRLPRVLAEVVTLGQGDITLGPRGPVTYPSYEVRRLQSKAGFAPKPLLPSGPEGRG